VRLTAIRSMIFGSAVKETQNPRECSIADGEYCSATGYIELMFDLK